MAVLVLKRLVKLKLVLLNFYFILAILLYEFSSCRVHSTEVVGSHLQLPEVLSFLHPLICEFSQEIL